jgi:drug/metabolite transporter (DMT)-like permease
MLSERERQGIFAAIGASLMMAAMGAAIKVVGADAGNEMVVFLRNGFGLLFLLPGLLHHGPGMLRTRRPGGHLARSVSGLAAMYCFFYAIVHLHLAEAVLLNFSSPIFTAILAALWLKEPVSRKTVIAVAIGLAGIVFILKPGPGIWSSAAPIGVMSGILAALAMVNIRSLSSTEPTYRIVLYFAIVSTAISAVPAFLHWRPPTPHTLAFMAAAGLFATMGQYMMTFAYSTAHAARVGTLNYSTVIFAGLFGWWLWGEVPDALSAVGAVLVCVAGMLVARRSPSEAD